MSYFSIGFIFLLYRIKFDFNATICSVVVDFRLAEYKVKAVYLSPVLLPFLPKGEIKSEVSKK